jgi:hypothetical protein
MELTQDTNKPTMENSLGFPTLNKREIEMFLTIINSKEFMLNGESYLKGLLVVSESSDRFNSLIYHLKQMIHVINRTTALENAYIMGVMIGIFMCKPELVPSPPEEEKGLGESPEG